MPVVVISAITLSCAILLAYADQARECYLLLAQDAWNNVVPIALTVIGVTIAAFSVWIASVDYLSSSIQRQLALHKCDDVENNRYSSSKFMLSVGPILLGMAIPAGLAVGIYRAISYIESHREKYNIVLSEKQDLKGEFNQSSLTIIYENVEMWLFLVACVVVVTSIICAHIFFSYGIIRHLSKVRPYLYAAFYLLFATIALSIFKDTVTVSRFIGALGLVLLFVSCLVIFVSSLSRVYFKYRFPLLTLALVWIAFVFYSEISLPTISPKSGDYKKVRDPDKVFIDWYRQRKDRSFYEQRGQPYPIFLIAASGGGLYAAQHSALFLSRMQDHCPNFAQHIFAFSGVSGGSLGVSVFSGLAESLAANQERKKCEASPRKTRKFEELSSDILKNDFLSPIVGTGLFLGFIQTLVPIPSRMLDRSRAFELAVEKSWKQASTLDPDFYHSNFLSTWSEASVSGAMVLNATDADRGTRLTISPFRINYIKQRELSGVAWLQEDLNTKDDSQPEGLNADISVGEAVSLSARFPIVVPPGVIEIERDGYPAIVRQVIDGGYYDSSGIETALDLIVYLKQFETPIRSRKPPRWLDPLIKVHLIIVRSSYELALSGSRRLSSKLSPIRGIQAVREGRGHVAVGRAFLDRVPCLLPPAPEPEKCDATRLELMNLNLIDFDVPLAWQLSPKAVELVFLHSGNVSSSEVAQDNVRQAPISVYETLLRNNRSFQRIVKILD